MDYSQRRVVEVPIEELWNDHGPVVAEKVRDELTEAEIQEMLRAGDVQFIDAAFGGSMRWVPPEEQFDFWKNDVQPLLTQWGPDNRVYAHDFAIASLWRAKDSPVPHVLVTGYS